MFYTYCHFNCGFKGILFYLILHIFLFCLQMVCDIWSQTNMEKERAFCKTVA